MRILLDTHAFLWWLAGDGRLGVAARQAIGDDAGDAPLPPRFSLTVQAVGRMS